MQHRPAALRFHSALERAQGRHAAAAGDLKPDLAFADDQRQHSVGFLGVCRLDCRDAQGKTHRPQPRRAQRLLQPLHVALGNSDERGVLPARRGDEPRGGDLQRCHIGGKSALGFDLQKAGDVRFRELGQCGMGGERPFQRQGGRAAALAHTGGLKMIENFAPDQLRVVGQRIQRQGRRESLMHLEGTVASAQNDALQPAAIQRQPQHA